MMYDINDLMQNLCLYETEMVNIERCEAIVNIKPEKGY